MLLDGFGGGNLGDGAAVQDVLADLFCLSDYTRAREALVQPPIELSEMAVPVSGSAGNPCPGSSPTADLGE